MAPHFIDKPHERDLWAHPWKVGLSSGENSDFKAKLRANGYLSPHFTIAEAASKATGNCARELPVSNDLIRAQYHAFALERVRHDLGDRPMSPTSWLRSVCHNSEVGGVSNSQHLNGWATDWSDEMRSSLGGTRFDDAMDRQFAGGGRGYVGAVGGQIRHVDNGPARVWTY